MFVSLKIQAQVILLMSVALISSSSLFCFGFGVACWSEFDLQVEQNWVTEFLLDSLCSGFALLLEEIVRPMSGDAAPCLLPA